MHAKKFQTVFVVAAAAAAVAFTPVSATAKTRAGDSGAASSVSAPDIGRTAKGSKASGESIGLGIAAVAAVVGGIIVLSSDGGGDDTVRSLPPVSPGT